MDLHINIQVWNEKKMCFHKINKIIIIFIYIFFYFHHWVNLFAFFPVTFLSSDIKNGYDVFSLPFKSSFELWVLVKLA